MKNITKKVLFVVPIGIGVYLIIRQFTKGSKRSVEPQVIQGEETSETSSSSGNTSFPLKKGSRGEKVKELQRKLLSKDSRSLPMYGADGIFGNETETALKNLFNRTQINNQTELDSLIWRAPMALQPNQGSQWPNYPWFKPL